MLARLGFVASVLTENLTTSRTCRLRNGTDERLRELIVENLTALDQVASFLERQRIFLYRISSNLIPFASHPVNSIPWWDEYADTLTPIGARLRALGVRISTHPGQYTVLNSPHRSIVSAAVSELVYQNCRELPRGRQDARAWGIGVGSSEAPLTSMGSPGLG